LKVASKPTGRVDLQRDYENEGDYDRIRLIWYPLYYPENGGEINTTYTVLFAEGKYDSQWNVLCKGAVSYCEATIEKHGIIPLRTYKFKVIATNALGNGPDSTVLYTALTQVGKYSSSEGVTYLFFSFIILLSTLC
jgi:hypothetical protein